MCLMFEGLMAGARAWCIQVCRSPHDSRLDDETLLLFQRMRDTSGTHVWATGWGCVDLHRAGLHGIADVDGLVDVLREYAALRNKTRSSIRVRTVAYMGYE
jgi:hypothetical protein